MDQRTWVGKTFKGCVQIADSYHLLQHAGLVLAVLVGKNHPDHNKRLNCWGKQLLKDKVPLLLKPTRQECAAKPSAEAVEEALHHFASKVSEVSRMQYGTFRKAGYFIGSGVVEAGRKIVIGARRKQSGIFW